MQDEITEAVTIAIAPAIADAEQQRALRKRPESFDAWAAFQRGLWHLGKFTADDNLVAQRFFQQAIDVDPTFTGGYSGLAEAQLYAVITFGTRSLLDVQKPVEALARQAVALDSADPESRLGLGITMLMSGDFGGRRKRDRAGSRDQSEFGHRARSAGCDADLFWAAEGRARCYPRQYQAQSS